ncbi:tetratricopeptide repeat protein [Streptomyces chartreusis]|jgi:tetratricopeptide (TPR) repeat protein|uniref:tetratricopeptide repeat protein n=1 Tax=Streptomyces chartreusis TaxID=1969 RepID=UPI00386988B3|nr:tetratricopeptide repeat protein [Streptomyces chartreusis]WTA29146.1 tetratricopeptide repeat protein [Streptomyces chartreusis]
MSKRPPNASLSRLLAETGWSQRQLATAVNRVGTESGMPLRYDDSAVNHWLDGTIPREAVRPLILEALSRKLRRPITHADAGFPPPKPATSGGLDTLGGLMELGRQDMDPSRRGVLGAALFSVALTIPDWPDVVGRLSAVQSGKARRIGYREVDAVVAMTEKVSELDDQFGGRAARPMAAAFLVNTVVPHLQADAPEDVRKALLSATSDLLYLTGFMAVDEGLQGLAQRYYVKALELAGEAEDHLTFCTTLRGMSLQAVDLGHNDQAVRLADAAAAASPNAGPRMRAFLAGQQAHAYAASGSGYRGEALQFIKEAEVAMERAESRAKAFGSYAPSSLAYHVSQVRYALGDKKGAVVSLKESNRLRHSHYRRVSVRYNSLLAERELELGRLEEACATWDKVLDDYPLVQSGSADQKISNMQALLKPHLRNRAAHAVYERSLSVSA